MARSNTCYFNICLWADEIGEDGYCDIHRRNPHWRHWGGQRKCIAPNSYMTRRGMFERRSRFEGAGWKQWSYGPPMAIKKIWRRQVRAKYRAELQRTGEIAFDGHKFLAGLYGWWF